MKSKIAVGVVVCAILFALVYPGIALASQIHVDNCGTVDLDYGFVAGRAITFSSQISFEPFHILYGNPLGYYYDGWDSSMGPYYFPPQSADTGDIVEFTDNYCAVTGGFDVIGLADPVTPTPTPAATPSPTPIPSAVRVTLFTATSTDGNGNQTNYDIGLPTDPLFILGYSFAFLILLLFFLFAQRFQIWALNFSLILTMLFVPFVLTIWGIYYLLFAAMLISIASFGKAMFKIGGAK